MLKKYANNFFEIRKDLYDQRKMIEDDDFIQFINEQRRSEMSKL